jgi:hypothetical protein
VGRAGRRRLLSCCIAPRGPTGFCRPEQRAAGLVAGGEGWAHFVLQIKIGLVRDEECGYLQFALACGMVQRGFAELGDPTE